MRYVHNKQNIINTVVLKREKNTRTLNVTKTHFESHENFFWRHRGTTEYSVSLLFYGWNEMVLSRLYG